MKVIIRPLEENDAYTSYKWRNDPEIWRLTGKKPDREITLEIELAWIKDVLNRKNEKRFAICVGDENEYVGNVQLTDITSASADFHIFIGKKEYHGRGIGTNATKLILEFAFKQLGLCQVFLNVKRENIGAIKAYRRCGFTICDESEDHIKMVVNIEDKQL